MKKELTIFANYFLAILASLAFIAPIVFMITSAFKEQLDLFSIPPKILFKPSLIHFKNIFESGGYAAFDALKNSVIVLFGTVLLVLVISILTAYPIARFKFRGRSSLAVDILSIRMLPPIAVAIPIYFIGQFLNLLDNYLILILINTLFNLPLAVWLMKTFIQEVPKSVEEAALLDGCTNLQMIYKITLPLIIPGIIATLTLVAIFVWNEFLFANILTGTATRTLPVATANSVRWKDIAWGEACAFGVVCSIPVLLLYLIAQKYLVRGLTFGLLK